MLSLSLLTLTIASFAPENKKGCLAALKVQCGNPLPDVRFFPFLFKMCFLSPSPPPLSCARFTLTPHPTHTILSHTHALSLPPPLATLTALQRKLNAWRASQRMGCLENAPRSEQQRFATDLPLHRQCHHQDHLQHQRCLPSNFIQTLVPRRAPVMALLLSM